MQQRPVGWSGAAVGVLSLGGDESECTTEENSRDFTLHSEGYCLGAQCPRPPFLQERRSSSAVVESRGNTTLRPQQTPPLQKIVRSGASLPSYTPTPFANEIWSQLKQGQKMCKWFSSLFFMQEISLSLSLNWCWANKLACYFYFYSLSTSQRWTISIYVLSFGYLIWLFSAFVLFISTLFRAISTMTVRESLKLVFSNIMKQKKCPHSLTRILFYCSSTHFQLYL